MAIIPASIRSKIQTTQRQIHKMMLPTHDGKFIGYNLVHYNIEYMEHFEMVGYKYGKIISVCNPDSEPWILATLMISRNNGGFAFKADGVMGGKDVVDCKQAFLPIAWSDDVVVDFDDLRAGEKKPIVCRPDQIAQIRAEFLKWFDRGGGSH